MAAEDPWGTPLYEHPLDNQELNARVALAHRPFHEALDQLIEASLRHHQQILLLDLHSFGMPLGTDIVIGDHHGKTADHATLDEVEDAFTAGGFRVRRNDPFSGGRITARYLSDNRVNAVQIELNQRTYLLAEDVDRADPNPRRDEAGWQRTRRRLRTALGTLRLSPAGR